MNNPDVTRMMELLKQERELTLQIEQLSRAKAELEEMQDGPTSAGQGAPLSSIARPTGEVAANADTKASHPAPGDVHAELLVCGREPGVLSAGVHGRRNQGGTGEATPHPEQGGGGGTAAEAGKDPQGRQEQPLRPVTQDESGYDVVVAWNFAKVQARVRFPLPALC